jgi:hypothetical protein
MRPRALIVAVPRQLLRPGCGLTGRPQDVATDLNKHSASLDLPCLSEASDKPIRHSREIPVEAVFTIEEDLLAGWV